MALVTTFATTPLTSALYPPWYQKKLEAWKRGEIDWDSGRPLTASCDSAEDTILAEKQESAKVKSLLVYLRLDNMPTLIAFISLLGGNAKDTAPRTHPSRGESSPNEDEAEQPIVLNKRPVDVHGVRLLELTERDSSVMKVSEIDEYSIHDPLVNTFRTFGVLYNLSVSGEVAVVPQSSYATVLINKAAEEASDLLLLPWSETGGMSEALTLSADNVQHKLESNSYAAFVTDALNNAACNTAVFINRGFSGSVKQRPSALQRSASAFSVRSARDHATTRPKTDRSHHIFMPFFGSLDDRVALRLVLQLAENPEITATIVHFEHPADANTELNVHSPGPVTQAGKNGASTATTVHQEQHAAFFAAMSKSLPADLISRVVLQSMQTSQPLKEALSRAQEEVGQNPKNAGDLVIVGRNAALFGRGVSGSECLGTAADAIIGNGLKASVLVMQAKGKGAE